jgi:uncharacterized protein
MRIALIGGTGFVGARIQEEALRRRHEVTLLTRDPGRVEPHAGLHAVATDVFVASQVAERVRGHDGVASAFNAGWKNPRLYDDYLRGTRAIVAGVKASGVRRLLLVGGAGSLEVSPGVQFVDTPEFPIAAKAGALAAREALHLIRKERELEWTFVSPAIHLEEGPRTALYRTGRDVPIVGAGGRSYISVADLAVAIVDELERPQHIRARFTVGY